jgi:hypothetical protein
MKSLVRKFDELETNEVTRDPNPRSERQMDMIDDPALVEATVSPREAISLTKKSTKQRPNFFLGIRLTKPFFQQLVTDFQQNILLRSPHLKKALVSVQKLHLTCFVFHLSSEEEIQRARECLLNSQPQLSEMISSFSQRINETFSSAVSPSSSSSPDSPLVLTFDSMNQFGSNVLFFSPLNDPTLHLVHDLNSYLSQQFQEIGLFTDPQEIKRVHNWQPHLTIMKTSRQSSHQKKKIQIKKEDYENCTNVFDGGEVTRVEINQIDLLSMSEPSEADGYYKSYGTILLQG